MQATTPIPVGSDDAHIARASQLQHAIEDMNRHADFSHPTFVYTERSPSSITCFDCSIDASTLARLLQPEAFCQALLSAMHGGDDRVVSVSLQPFRSAPRRGGTITATLELARFGHGVAPSGSRAADLAPRKARIGRVLVGLVIQNYP
jgi:hypothetical protein